MRRPRRMTALLACALLALPGLAGASPGPAQASEAASPYRARNFYFVFKLGTTLPLTVQDTPECAVDREAGSGGLTAATGRLISYSFVSPLNRAALAGALDAFLREHTFQPAELPPAERDRPGGRDAARTLTDPEAPGFSYTVRLHARPAGTSALCVNLRLPTPPNGPAAGPDLPPSQETP